MWQCCKDCLAGRHHSYTLVAARGTSCLTGVYCVPTGDKQGADTTLTPADSVASPDALNPVIPDGSKPADPGELSTNDQPADDAVMAEAQDSAVQAADTATPVVDTPADPDRP